MDSTKLDFKKNHQWSNLIKVPVSPNPLNLQFNHPIINPKISLSQKLQTYEENTIIKAPTSTIRWLKYAKTLEFDNTLQQYSLSFIFHLSDWIGFEAKGSVLLH